MSVTPARGGGVLPVIDSAPLIEGYPPNDCCHGATLLSSANKLYRFVKEGGGGCGRGLTRVRVLWKMTAVLFLLSLVPITDILSFVKRPKMQREFLVRLLLILLLKYIESLRT